MSNQQLAEAKPATIKAILNSDSMRAQIAACLPKHMTAERMVRVATTAMLRTPKLANCDQASFFKALLDLSAWGLEPDGRRAHLIPFENRKLGITEVQLILDYKGIVELARRSGEVATIHADVICKNDDFSYAFGSEQHLRHKPNMADRGPVLGSYAHVRLKDGTEQFEVLSKSEIDNIRGRSRAKDNGPWVTDYSEMAKKTAFRRLSKWLPISAEMADAFEADADSIRGERDVTPKQQTAPVPSLLREGPKAAPAPQQEPPEETQPESQIETEPPLEAQADAWGEGQPAPTPEPEPEPEKKPEPPKEKPAAKKPVNWKDHMIHFGEKTKGKTLGALAPSVLIWFADTWLPTARSAATKTKEDTALIAALEAYKLEVAA